MSSKSEITDNNFGDFEKLFQDHYLSLVRFAMTIVNSQEVAEDIVQDIFIKIWMKKKNIVSQKNKKGYLFVSVKHMCFDFVKKEVKNNKLTDLTSESFDLYNSTVIEELERNRKIFEAIEMLSIKGKIVLKLICFDNLKYKEVAEELDISVNTVKYHFKTSLKKLREILSKDYFIFLLHFSRNT